MKLAIEKRQRGHIPVGVLLMLPLFAMPIGGWLVERGWAHFGTCALKEMAGVPCLTCGATRATLRLLHGDLLGALSLQPMIIAVYFVLTAWGLTSLGLFAVDKRAKLKLSTAEDRVLKGAMIVIPLANWAYLIAAGI